MATFSGDLDLPGTAGAVHRALTGAPPPLLEPQTPAPKTLFIFYFLRTPYPGSAKPFSSLFPDLFCFNLLKSDQPTNHSAKGLRRNVGVEWFPPWFNKYQRLLTIFFVLADSGQRRSFSCHRGEDPHRCFHSVFFSWSTSHPGLVNRQLRLAVKYVLSALECSEQEFHACYGKNLVCDFHIKSSAFRKNRVTGSVDVTFLNSAVDLFGQHNRHHRDHSSLGPRSHRCFSRRSIAAPVFSFVCRVCIHLICSTRPLSQLDSLNHLLSACFHVCVPYILWMSTRRYPFSIPPGTNRGKKQMEVQPLWYQEKEFFVDNLLVRVHHID